MTGQWDPKRNRTVATGGDEGPGQACSNSGRFRCFKHMGEACCTPSDASKRCFDAWFVVCSVAIFLACLAFALDSTTSC